MDNTVERTFFYILPSALSILLLSIKAYLDAFLYMCNYLLSQLKSMSMPQTKNGLLLTLFYTPRRWRAMHWL